MKADRLTKIAILGVVISIAVFSPIRGVYSRTLDDIQDDINQQNKELDKVKSELSTAQKRLKSLSASIDSAEGQIPKLKAEIKQLQAEIDYNNLELDLLKEKQELKELEQEEREVKQDQALHTAYRNWRTDIGFGSNLGGEGLNPLKKQRYQSTVIATEQGGIETLAEEIGEIESDIGEYSEATASLEKENKKLKQKKQELQAQIQALQGTYSSTSGVVAGLRAQAGIIQSNIKQLSQEQKALQEYEAWILGQNSNGGTKPLKSGQYYFTGVGRDLYQGHGVGMSQFGAYGAAKKGWSAERILTFYYTNTHIEQRPGKVSVAGYGKMDSNKYVAGLGEVPSKACGTAAQVAERPDKYATDNPSTVWDCWPEEAIKAQVIAARSYALSYGGTLCTSASCQVYIGGNAKKWAADETKDMVVISDGYTHTGQIIRALYSSDNNQGYGTANNETIWSSNKGVGTPYSYLRAKNDAGFAYKTTYSSWSWRTNGYTLNDGKNSFKTLLTFASKDSKLSVSSRSFVSSIKSAVGDISSVTFSRDSSKRVAKVHITGTNGVKKTMAGWFFKAIWNSWVNQKKPTGQKDFIYSLTYFLLQK